MHAGFHHQFIDLGDGVEGFLVHTADNLGNGFQTVNLVTGVNALRRIADFEIHAAFKPGLFFQNRHTDIFGHTGINRAFINHDRAFREVAADGVGRTLNRGQIRRVVVIDGRRHSDDVEFCFAQFGFVGGKFHGAIFDCFVADFVGRVNAFFVKLDFRGV